MVYIYDSFLQRGCFVLCHLIFDNHHMINNGRVFPKCAALSKQTVKRDGPASAGYFD